MPHHAPLLWRHLTVVVAKEAVSVVAKGRSVVGSVEQGDNSKTAAQQQGDRGEVKNVGEAEAAGREAVSIALESLSGDCGSSAVSGVTASHLSGQSVKQSECSEGGSAALAQALRACMLLAHCCGSASECFWAAVAETEDTLRLARSESAEAEVAGDKDAARSAFDQAVARGALLCLVQRVREVQR